MARIFEFGTAPQAAAEGYKLVREVEGTEEQLMASHPNARGAPPISAKRIASQRRSRPNWLEGDSAAP